MKIILSPTKTMKDSEDGFDFENYPVFLEEANTLLNVLKSKSKAELKIIMNCSDKLTELNYNRFQSMDLRKRLVPAIFAYDGLAFKAIAAHIFTKEEYEFIKEHLYILSGFYGVLKPSDGVSLYRLEMQAQLGVGSSVNLVEFWGEKIYKEVYKNNDIVINLASKEYSQTIRQYLKSKDRFVDVVFGVVKNGKIQVKGTLAKMARGSMVRYIAENKVTEVNELKGFNELGFNYNDVFSNDDKLVFIKEK